MTPVGRFLYLDKAQAEVLKHEQAEDGSWERIVATHDGYQRLGMMHIRSVTAYQDDRWIIEDQVLPTSRPTHSAPRTTRLHWLLPDWEFELQNVDCGLRLKSPLGWIELAVTSNLSPVSMQLVRAGALLHGTGQISPTWGWVSPTYGVKEPALSFSVMAVGVLPITLISEWRFPNA
jgi:hypothetical protein